MNNNLNKLKQMNKLGKVSKILMVILLISPLIYIGYRYIDYKLSENSNNRDVKNDYVKNISQSNYNLEDDLIFSIRDSAEGYKSIIIGSVENVEHNRDGYSISSISGDNYSKVDYFQFKGSDYYIRSVHNIYTSEIYSITLINKDDLNIWTDFDDLQSKYAEQLNLKNKNDTTTYNKLVEMQKQNKYLKN